MPSLVRKYAVLMTELFLLVVTFPIRVVWNFLVFLLFIYDSVIESERKWTVLLVFIYVVGILLFAKSAYDHSAAKWPNFSITGLANENGQVTISIELVASFLLLLVTTMYTLYTRSLLKANQRLTDEARELNLLKFMPNVMIESHRFLESNDSHKKQSITLTNVGEGDAIELSVSLSTYHKDHFFTRGVHGLRIHPSTHSRVLRHSESTDFDFSIDNANLDAAFQAFSKDNILYGFAKLEISFSDSINNRYEGSWLFSLSRNGILMDWPQVDEVCVRRLPRKSKQVLLPERSGSKGLDIYSYHSMRARIFCGTSRLDQFNRFRLSFRLKPIGSLSLKYQRTVIPAEVVQKS